MFKIMKKTITIFILLFIAVVCNGQLRTIVSGDTIKFYHSSIRFNTLGTNPNIYGHIQINSGTHGSTNYVTIDTTGNILTTGSLGNTTYRVVKVWAVNAEFTNLPTIGGASLSALYTSGNISIGTNSLLLTGSIASTGSRCLYGWFTDLAVTNRPTYNGSGLISVGDTATLVAHYIHRTDTAAMLGHYIHRTDTATMLVHYGKILNQTFLGSSVFGSISVASVDTVTGIQTAKTVAGKGLLVVTNACTLNSLAGGVKGQVQKFMIPGAVDLTLTGINRAVSLIFDGTSWYITGKNF
jgi:hypothetical protein